MLILVIVYPLLMSTYISNYIYVK